jgi:hypothetical protein
MDIMIHSNSCHPIEHKFAGINYLINRIATYPITKCNINIEEKTINHLLKNNGYHYLNIRNLIRRRQLHANEDNNSNNKNQNKWAILHIQGMKQDP